MQPLDPDATSPRSHEPALNHIGLWVDDLAAAVEWLDGAGRCASRRAASARARRATTCASSTPRATRPTPLGGEGVLIELVQAPADVVDALGAAR